MQHSDSAMHIPAQLQRTMKKRFMEGATVTQLHDDYPWIPLCQLKRWCKDKNLHAQRMEHQEIRSCPTEEEIWKRAEEMRAKWTQEASSRRWVGRYARRQDRSETVPDEYLFPIRSL